MINSMGDSYYKSGIYPIWGWYIYNGLYRKPDLRYSGQGEHGEQMVCVELEISAGNNIKGDWNSQMDKLHECHIPFVEFA
ncbi:hypothetical protein ACR77J_06290 [Tissierella praeacuta]